MKAYVSTIVEKDGKFILVREAKQRCFGKWNLPSGHVEENEYIFSAAIREVKEETNLDVKLDGLISVYNNMFDDCFSISFVFTSKLENSNEIKFDTNEIMETNWFTFEEIKNMQEELRDKDYVINSIEKYISGDVKSLDIIQTR